MLEKTLVKQIVKYLNSIEGCKAEKNHGSPYMKRGRPDIDVSYHGRHGVIEAKIWPNRPTAAQYKQLREWEAAGSITLIAYDLEQVKQEFP